MRVAIAVADSGGVFHPVQRDVQQQRADHPALRSSLLGRGEPALLDHAGLQPSARSVPWRGTCRAGRADGRGRCGRTPLSGPRRGPTAAWTGSALQRPVDRLDRVVTATSGPEPVRSRLEPGLPLRLQRVGDPGLLHPVDDHRNAERTLLPVRLRDVHPLDRSGLPGRRVPVQIHRQRRPVREVNATSPSTPAVLRPALSCVTRRTLTSVFDRLRSISFCRLRTRLRSPSCDALKILCRSRRTSSSTGRQSIASQSRSSSSRSVHATDAVSNVSVSVQRLSSRRLLSKAHLAHVSTLSGPGTRPVSGQLSETRRWRRRPCWSRFPVAFRPPAFASWAILFPPGSSAFLTVGPPDHAGPDPTGFPRSTCARPGRGGCPLYPGAAVFSRPVRCLRSPPAASQRPALHPGPHPISGAHLDEASSRFTHVHPSGLPLTCGPRMERGPLGFFPELRTPPLPATHVRAGTGHRTLTRATSSTSPPTSNQRATRTCDLVSHHPRDALRCG